MLSIILRGIYANYPWKEGAQKRHAAFSQRAAEYGGSGFSAVGFQRAADNERAPLRPGTTTTVTLPTYPVPPAPHVPTTAATFPLTSGFHSRCQQVGARGCHRHNLARPGTWHVDRSRHPHDPRHCPWCPPHRSDYRVIRDRISSNI